MGAKYFFKELKIMVSKIAFFCVPLNSMREIKDRRKEPTGRENEDTKNIRLLRDDRRYGGFPEPRVLPFMKRGVPRRRRRNERFSGVSSVGSESVIEPD
jgi:hypothetical protein